MGQEIHRQGLILNSRLDGSTVEVEVPSDKFSIAMLGMHLQMNYGNARIGSTTFGPDRDKVVSIEIEFGSIEDAIHFHLKQ